MIKINFDIQRVHVDGSSLHYDLMYKQDNIFKKASHWQFMTRQCAINFMNMHLLD